MTHPSSISIQTFIDFFLVFQVCSKNLSIFDIKDDDSSKLWKIDGEPNNLPFTFDNQLKLQSTSANPDSPDDDDEEGGN